MYAYISIKYPVQQKSGNRSDLVHVAVSFGLSLLRYGIQVTPPPLFPLVYCSRHKRQELRYVLIILFEF